MFGHSAAAATPSAYQPPPNNSSPFDAYKAVHEYVHRILGQVSGMKAMVLDSETITMVSVVYSQSESLLREVFLTENIDLLPARRDFPTQSFPHLTAVLILQPSPATLHSLQQLLAVPRYPVMHLFFTNVCPPGYLDSISRADTQDYVKSVYEYYMDFYALDRSLFHLNNSSHTAASRLYPPVNVPLAQRLSALFDRDVAGVVALLLSQKKRPDIRYSASSHQAQTVAQSVSEVMRNERELFTFSGEGSSTLLLVLDRRDDPVTPLLTQWTYQSMVHELLGIRNNRIDMRHAPGIATTTTTSTPGGDGIVRPNDVMNKDLQEVVLNPQQDDFFRDNQFCNYGEIGANVKALVARYQAVTKSNVSLESIQALQDFVDKYPQYRQLSGNVSKHVSVVSAVSKITSQRKLLLVSEVEQEIVCGSVNAHVETSERLRRLLSDREEDKAGRAQLVEFSDKLRLMMLYALRYTGSEGNHVSEFKELLAGYALDARDKQRLGSVDRLLEYYNSNFNSVQTVNASMQHSQQNRLASKRQQLFDNSQLLGIFKAVATELKGIDNIYTQHKPLLVHTVTRLLSGDLSTHAYPFVDQQSAKLRYKNVIVYMVGGVTYEEHCALELLMRIKTSAAPISASSSSNDIAATSTTRQHSDDGSPQPAPPSDRPDKRRFDDMLLKGVQKVGKNVATGFGHVGATVSTVVGTAEKAVTQAMKFNPRDYRVMLGGSCVLNSRDFLNEIHPVDDDLFGGRLGGGGGAAGVDGGMGVGSIEAAVDRQNARLGPPRGRGGRGGYAPVRGGPRGGRGGAMRGRGRGGYNAVPTGDEGGGGGGGYRSASPARPAGHGY